MLLMILRIRMIGGVEQDLYASVSSWPTLVSIINAGTLLTGYDAFSYWPGEDQIVFCANPGDKAGHAYSTLAHQMFNLWDVSRETF
jgi:hypothetical protein